MNSPTAPTVTPSAVTANPPRWRKWLVRLALALLVLAVIAWGTFTYLCFNPLEGEVEDLSRVIPASSVIAIHGSVSDVREAPFVVNRVIPEWKVMQRDLLVRLAGEDFSPKQLDLEEEIRRAEAELNRNLPDFLKGFTLEGDLLGRETAFFGVPDMEAPEDSRVAIATRISGKARMILSTLKHDWMRRRIENEAGLTITRSPMVYTVDLTTVLTDPMAPEAAYAALVKDVLIVGTDRDLVTSAAQLASGAAAGALPDRADASDLFTEGTAAFRVFADLESASADFEETEGITPGEWLRTHDGLTGLLGFLLDPDLLATTGVGISFPGDEQCRVRLQGVRGDRAYSEAAAALVDAPLAGGTESLAEAAALAPAGSAVLACRLELPAGTLVRLLYGRASAEVRKAVDEGLVEAKTSIDDIARDADDLLKPGVSIVLERLPDCDGIALDTFGADAEGKFVLPLPGVLLAMRLRDEVTTSNAETFLRRVRNWVPLRTYQDLEDLDPGMSGFRAEPKFLTQDKSLVKPAVAFHGDLVLLASNEGTLRRALEARDGRRANYNDMEGFWDGAGLAGEGQAHVLVDGEALLKMLRDDRREVATERVHINWAEERKRIHRNVVLEVMKDRQVIVQREIVKMVDRKVEQRREVQRDVEFPEAVKEYLAELDRWSVLRSIVVSLAWDDSGARVATVLRTED